MFCYQCEQTAKGEGCTKIGVCGKQPDVAALQYLLIYALKGLSLVAVAGALWVGFSANRDAANRMEKIRRAFAVHGDEARLLFDHWLVYVVILVRLEIMVVGGLVVALWGLGPVFGVWVLVLGLLMIGLTWPTARKSRLLLGRARALRSEDEVPAGA